MTFTLYDEHKTEILSTTNMTYAFNYLKDRIPMRHMCTKEQLQEAINFDTEHNKPYSIFGFYISDTEKEICKLRVDYAK